MAVLERVNVPAVPLAALGSIIGEKRLTRLELAALETRRLLDGRVLWNVSSTASGGGVAEMLHVLLGYVRGAGVNGQWRVIQGDRTFFAITKRLHNHIHGLAGDGGELGRDETSHYEAVTSDNALALADQVCEGDVVLLHDPQTAGMAPSLRRSGAKVIWRSHIGTDKSTSLSDGAWRFLEPYLRDCDAFVFTRQAYIPDWIPLDRVAIIPPSIDPLSPKNEPIADKDLPIFLAQIGLTAGPTGGRATYARADGTIDLVTRQATIVCEGGPLENSSGLVVQVSRWDRLKDMVGVLNGFASGVCGRVDADLALVGPEVESVSDDPEGAEVLEECVANWSALPFASRRRIRLVTLPMADVQENAVMVNAIQRSATVIVQKSLEEGFGLTVAEGMWKGKPVVASAVGGIVEQVAPGTGVLLDDPTDLDAFGDTVADLLEHPHDMTTLGVNAYRHVLDQFVGDLHLLRYAELIEHMLQN
jgi:trehalose synthase